MSHSFHLKDTGRIRLCGHRGNSLVAPENTLAAIRAAHAEGASAWRWWALTGLALGLVGGLGAAIGLDLLRDTIRTREDMRSKLGLACIGQIPKRQTKGDLSSGICDGTIWGPKTAR